MVEGLSKYMLLGLGANKKKIKWNEYNSKMNDNDNAWPKKFRQLKTITSIYYKV